uniref:Uncharacterized protein n=1 Tax=Ascaris lumbricoides TaxID=6252 RepID=A0A0M3IXI3_ASCLU
MYRWQEKERMDENGVTLRGQFVAVGLLADAVHDGQNVCIEWDIANEVSFALIRQPDPEQICEELWLYNRYLLIYLLLPLIFRELVHLVSYNLLHIPLSYNCTILFYRLILILL